MSGIFISYRRSDSAGWVGRIRERLKSSALGEERIFVDIDTITPGDDFIEAIDEAVGECDVFVEVIGPNWLHAITPGGDRRLDDSEDLLRHEILVAIHADKTILPILVGGAVMPSAMDLPAELASFSRRHAFEISDIRFDQDIESLIQHLSGYISNSRTKDLTSANLEIKARAIQSLSNIGDEYLIQAVPILIEELRKAIVRDISTITQAEVKLILALIQILAKAEEQQSGSARQIISIVKEISGLINRQKEKEGFPVHRVYDHGLLEDLEFGILQLEYNYPEAFGIT